MQPGSRTTGYFLGLGFFLQFLSTISPQSPRTLKENGAGDDTPLVVVIEKFQSAKGAWKVKATVRVMLVLLAVLLAGALPASAHGGGHGGGHVFIGVGPIFPFWWGPPAYVYQPAPVIVRQEPAPVYVEPAPQPEAPTYWYYCRDSRAYYPYVKECPGGWKRVAPTPPQYEREGE